MTTKRIIAKLIALFGISLFVLNACSSTTESSDAVIGKFKQAIKEVKSADMSIAVSMKGKDNEDNIDFSLNADAKFDRKDEDRKADVSVKVGGNLAAGGQKLDGELDIRIITLGEEFYFNLATFDSSDPSTEKIETVLKPYIAKWQHLSKDFIPEDIKKLQKKDEETLKKEEQLKDLFINTKLFEVTKEYGIEKLDGNKVYHYAIKLDKEGVKDYIKKASTINGVEKTDAEVTEASTFVDSVTNMELWIGAKDYFLYKGVVEMAGQKTTGTSTSSISVTYTARSYNSTLKIEAPAEFEEFNPITLLMGMQLNSEEPADTSVITDETTASEETISPVVEGTVNPDGSVTTEQPIVTTEAPAVTEAPVTTEVPADTTTTPAQ